MLYAMLYAVNIRFAIFADDRAVDLCVVYMRATYSKYILHKSSKPATYIWVRLIIGCVQYTLKYGSCCYALGRPVAGFRGGNHWKSLEKKYDRQRQTDRLTDRQLLLLKLTIMLF